MKELKELIHFVSESCYNTLPIIHTDEAESQNLEDVFYHTYLAESSEKAHAKSIYQGSQNIEQKRIYPYKSLRTRFKKKLLNHLLFIDYEKVRWVEREKAQHEALYNYQIGRSLYSSGTDYKTAKNYLKKALNISIEYECLSVAVMSLACLIDTQMSTHLKPSERKEYIRKYTLFVDMEQVQNKALLAEMQCRQIVETSPQKIKNNPVPQKQRAFYLTQIDILKQYYEQTGLNSIYFQYNRVLSRYCEIFGDYLRLQKLLDECITKVQQNELNPKNFNIRYSMYMKTFCCLMLGDYDRGITYTQEVQKHFIKNSFNWFSLQQHYILLALHKGDFELCYEILKDLKTRPDFYSVPTDKQKEEWLIFEGFLKLLKPELFGKLHFDKLCSQLELSRKMKTTMNVNLLFLELAYLLQNRKREDFIRKLENAGNYYSYHLQETKAHTRAKLFLRLLSKIEKEEFNATQARESGRSTLRTLKKLPYSGTMLAGYEVFPYHKLWLHILKMVRKTNT